MTHSPEPKSRRRWLLVLLLGVLLHAPSVTWEFFADDHGHELVLSGAFEHPSMRPWALYDFGTLGEQVELRDAEGTFPYWTPPDWRVKFLRPVASCARWLEHLASRGSAVGTHLFGLAWWGLLLAACWWMFRTVGLPAGAATWALAFVALQNGNVFSVGWPANRNSVVEALFLVASVATFAGAASNGRRLAAFGLAALAVLSKESGVVAFPLLALLAWRRGDRGWAVAALASAAAYVTCYVLAGYGSNTPFYPTPWQEPGAWGGRLALLVPCLVVYATTPLSSDVTQVLPEALGVLVALGVVLWALLARPLRAACAAVPAGTFLVAFALVALLPQAGAPLSDRLFLVPGVALAGLLGTFAWRVGERRRAGDATRTERALRAGLVTAGLALSALSLLVVGLDLARVARWANGAVAEADVDPRGGERRDAFVLQAPSQLVALQPYAAWVYGGGDPDVRFWPLSFSREGVRFERTGEREFELVATGAPFFSSLVAGVFLTTSYEVRVGSTWSTDVMEVVALELRDGRPTRVRVRLARPLDDPSVRFLRWRAPLEGEEGRGRWVHVPPPAVGRSTTVHPVEAPFPFLP